ncbi:hypothetical protein [Halobacillus sp. A5]|uniref:hypothetical protein n=1 Tax=Halobacillus sp. A5 TaxID=2880263 RepID=UPI0020A65342|nr:hypothetical protein [Halobacillus sp. A5]MCP3027889.1 hypothetical protein [Halobacillus sp. A5]
MKNLLRLIIFITGVYLLSHLIIGLDIERNVMMFGVKTPITYSLITRITGAAFFGSLLLYVLKYNRSNSSNNQKA